MTLTLTRTIWNPQGTIGQLQLGDAILCLTLEDPPGEGKGPIPAGRYRVTLTYSGRFQMLLPEVLLVPGFTAIRIHAGNTAKDTEGCILVGTYQSGAGEIAESRVALGKLLDRWREWHDDTLVVKDRA